MSDPRGVSPGYSARPGSSVSARPGSSVSPGYSVGPSFSRKYSAGPEYTGKHRRATGLGPAGWPASGGRYGPPRPVPEGTPGADGIQAAGAVIPGPWPRARMRPGTGRWPDAG